MRVPGPAAVSAISEMRYIVLECSWRIIFDSGPAAGTISVSGTPTFGGAENRQRQHHVNHGCQNDRILAVV